MLGMYGMPTRWKYKGMLEKVGRGRRMRRREISNWERQCQNMEFYHSLYYPEIYETVFGKSGTVSDNGRQSYDKDMPTRWYTKSNSDSSIRVYKRPTSTKVEKHRQNTGMQNNERTMAAHPALSDS